MELNKNIRVYAEHVYVHGRVVFNDDNCEPHDDSRNGYNCGFYIFRIQSSSNLRNYVSSFAPFKTMCWQIINLLA